MVRRAALSERYAGVTWCDLAAYQDLTSAPGCRAALDVAGLFRAHQECDQREECKWPQEDAEWSGA